MPWGVGDQFGRHWQQRYSIPPEASGRREDAHQGAGVSSPPERPVAQSVPRAP